MKNYILISLILLFALSQKALSVTVKCPSFTPGDFKNGPVEHDKNRYEFTGNPPESPLVLSLSVYKPVKKMRKIIGDFATRHFATFTTIRMTNNIELQSIQFIRSDKKPSSGLPRCHYQFTFGTLRDSIITHVTVPYHNAQGFGLEKCKKSLKKPDSFSCKVVKTKK